LQTAVYPIDSPGGWQIIGRTPLRMFNPANQQPSRLQPGDEVRFRSISREEFVTLAAEEHRR
jgi:inhibitor of KinA